MVARRLLTALPAEHRSEHTETPPPPDGLMTAEEIAQRLGVKPGWVYRQSRAGSIPTVRLGRYYRYRLDAIEEWLAEREHAA